MERFRKRDKKQIFIFHRRQTMENAYGWKIKFKIGCCSNLEEGKVALRVAVMIEIKKSKIPKDIWTINSGDI